MRHPYLILASLCLVVLLLGCKSQQVILSESTLVAPQDSLPPPVIFANLGDSLQPILLDSLRIKTSITGSLVQTTYEMAFYNPHDRQLEGKFFFPVEEGKSLSRFALDINGKWREGVVVPAKKGRVAYESTVRKSIDPALLEYGSGNVFKARIFPLPPGGHRKLILAFDEILKPTQQSYQYKFQSIFPQKLPFYQQEILVQGLNVPVKIDHPGISALENLSNRKKGYFQEVNASPVDFTLSFLGNEEASIAVEETKGGSTYFSTLIDIPTFTKEKRKPQKVCIYWDVSLPSKRRNTALELAFLRKALQEYMGPNFQVELVAFDVFVRKRVQLFIRNDVDVESLLEEIAKIPFDGAADFGILDLQERGTDEYWIFSNAQSPFELQGTSNAPVYAFLSSLGNKLPALQKVTRESKGQIINLEEGNLSEAIKRLKELSLKFLGIEYIEGTIEEVYPKVATPVKGPFNLLGKLLGDEAEIVLKFGYLTDAEPRLRLKINIDKVKQLASGKLISRRWAESKLSYLLENPRKNKEPILRLGQQYNIITPQTSMIVLDRLDDYIAYRIPPPEEWMATYQRAVRMEEEKEKAKLYSHLDEVAALFQARKIWWDTDFEVPPGKFLSQPSTKEGLDDSMQAEESMEVESDADGSIDDLVESGFSDEFEAPSEKEKGASNQQKEVRGSIDLAKIKLDAAYMDTLTKVKESQRETLYFSLRNTYGKLPSFYLDLADYFYSNGKEKLAMRIVSNLAVLQLSDHESLRILAYRYLQWGVPGKAISLLQEVLDRRDEEPQSYRDLGLAFAEAGRYQESIDKLYEVVKRSWDERFPEIGVIAAHEINAILARSEEPLGTTDIDPRFLEDLPCDLRIVMSWDANNVDLDLWVIDPRGERCYFRHPSTEIGGIISRDFTGGYGPEEFLLKKAPRGSYTIKANYYGDNRQRLNGPATLYVRAILDYGRKSQQSKDIILRLEKEQEVLELGSIKID